VQLKHTTSDGGSAIAVSGETPAVEIAIATASNKRALIAPSPNWGYRRAELALILVTCRGGAAEG